MSKNVNFLFSDYGINKVCLYGHIIFWYPGEITDE
jgi:hypothetical protein